MNNFILQTIFISFLLGGASSLKCYKCSSFQKDDYNLNCAKFYNPKDVDSIECKGMCETFEFNIENGTHTTRGCTDKCNKKKEWLNHKCCEGDLCNNNVFGYLDVLDCFICKYNEKDTDDNCYTFKNISLIPKKTCKNNCVIALPNAINEYKFSRYCGDCMTKFEKCCHDNLCNNNSMDGVNFTSLLGEENKLLIDPLKAGNFLLFSFINFQLYAFIFFSYFYLYF